MIYYDSITWIESSFVCLIGMDTTQKLKDKYLTRKESATNSSYSVFDKMIIWTASVIKVQFKLIRHYVKVWTNIKVYEKYYS